MKLRNFKKSIHRKKDYRYHEPRINQKILIKDDTIMIYYTCHKLSGRLCLETNEFVYIIKSKGKDMDKVKQPDWCNYPEADRPTWGCWSLLAGYVKDEDYCKNCDCYRGRRQK